MTHEDRETLGVALCKGWPNKFEDDSLAYWCKEFHGYDVEAVQAALTQFKNQSRFVPKVHEIKKRLAIPKVANRENVVTFGSFVSILRRGNPHLADRPDAEVVLRYHRHWWFRSPKSDVLRESVTGKCVRDLVETGMDADEAGRCAAFVFDEPHAFREALDDMVRVPATVEEAF
jgi:hypothetical protein